MNIENIIYNYLLKEVNNADTLISLASLEIYLESWLKL